MTQDEPDDKAIVVLTQAEIDTAIHGLEQVALGMDNDEFREVYGDVYRKSTRLKTRVAATSIA